MTRLQLERGQVLIYAAAIAAGCVLGLAAPRSGPASEWLLWPVLAALLYVTFAQVPLVELTGIARDGRFHRALLLTNFLVVPGLAWVLAQLLPPDPALVLGVYLVLLVPCTDWYVSFTTLGGGDARRAIASTPVLLLAQMITLPLYLWLFLGREFAGIVKIGGFLEAFAGLILLPLLLAVATEWSARCSRPIARWLAVTAWLPVPLLALTVLLIAGAQVRIVADSWRLLGAAALVFLAYAALIPLPARWIGRRFGLGIDVQRTLVFSAGTRNSFVVLPFALALPPEWRLAVAVIVLQSLVELAAMVAYLGWIPRGFLPRIGEARSEPAPPKR